MCHVLREGETILYLKILEMSSTDEVDQGAK